MKPVRSTASVLRSVRRSSLVGGSALLIGMGLFTATAGAATASGASPDRAAPLANPAVCSTYCDGTPVTKAKGDRLADGTTIYGRSIELHIDDRQAMGWAIIANGDPTDEVWLNRSFDGGKTWEDTRLGDTTIPAGLRTASTTMFNLNDPANNATGVVRACGKAGNVADIACTAWTGTATPPRPTTPARGAVDALIKLYNPTTGLFNTTGWWNSANALTGVIDYAQATGDHRYDWIIANTYEKNLTAQAGNFTNDYIDDTGWWALAWIRAYDLTHDKRYLQTAQVDVDYMWSYHDSTCGGGLWWSTAKTYKNAVTNELFIKASAELHNRIHGDTTYLDRSVSNWKWFQASGMINSDHMINDGLDNTTCKNNNGTTWSYNQGVILGGLNDLYAATHDHGYLTQAKALADASTRSTVLNPKGVLTEPCEATDCGGDGPTFKGVYVRNLGELNKTLKSSSYQSYLQRQGGVAWLRDRNPYNQYGVHWAGPVASISAATQASAVDAQVAAYPARGK
ncbi:MAG TPA: glycoside hydrolase family 76 protein [Mycobacteriales bacterium]|nr:glycoside hydrolase family 76 protein [Mycobacteriales bacterium]